MLLCKAYTPFLLMWRLAIHQLTTLTLKERVATRLPCSCLGAILLCLFPKLRNLNKESPHIDHKRINNHSSGITTPLKSNIFFWKLDATPRRREVTTLQHLAHFILLGLFIAMRPDVILWSQVRLSSCGMGQCCTTWTIPFLNHGWRSSKWRPPYST